MTVSEPIKATLNALRLGNILKDSDIQINESLDERGLEILLEFELQAHYCSICRQYKNEVDAIKSNVDAQMKSKVSEIMDRIHGSCGSISKAMYDEAGRMALWKFPTLVEELDFAQDGEYGEDAARNHSAPANFFALDQMKDWNEEYRDQVINIASNPDLQVAKKNLRAACKADSDGRLESFMKKGKLWLGASDHDILVESMLRDADRFSFRDDAEFVASLDAILRWLPSLEELVRQAKRALHEQIPKIISLRWKKLTNIALHLQERKYATQVKLKAEIRAKKASSNLRK
ncbi:hypothetical protein BDN67DRAFT_1011735 [Paxillus ammoniavirescens]|nr:hypothetical protein BDN67DRAFT_1011735 [Paxillus ammoniavirescens]